MLAAASTQVNRRGVILRFAAHSSRAEADGAEMRISGASGDTVKTGGGSSTPTIAGRRGTVASAVRGA